MGDTWTFVPSKRGSKKTAPSYKSDKFEKARKFRLMLDGAGEETNFGPNEVKRIGSQVEELIVGIKLSSFFVKLVSVVRDKIEKGSISQVFALGIGNFSTSVPCLVQFSTLVAVLREFQIDKCCLYDPVTNAADINICNLFSIRTDAKLGDCGRIPVHENSLFFMPHCPLQLYCGVLWSNWGIGLSKILIIGNSFESYGVRLFSSATDRASSQNSKKPKGATTSKGAAGTTSVEMQPVQCVEHLQPLVQEIILWEPVTAKSSRATQIENSLIGSDVTKYARESLVQYLGNSFNDTSCMSFGMESLTSGVGHRLLDPSSRPSLQQMQDAALLDDEIIA